MKMENSLETKLDLFVKGYSQQEGIYVEETFAPVARLEAIIMFFVFSSFQNLSNGCKICLP